jgi:hypothetical protein
MDTLEALYLIMITINPLPDILNSSNYGSNIITSKDQSLQAD